MKIKVYYELRHSNNDGHYGEDNPEADYPNEVYYPPTWSTFLEVQEIDFRDIKKAFDSEDGDEDFSRTITYITDETGKKHIAKKGDVLYISKRSKITINYSDKVGFEGFYVISPYNWRELIQGKESE